MSSKYPPSQRYYVVNKVGGVWNLWSAPDRKTAFKFKERVQKDLGKGYVKDIVRGQEQAFLIRDIAKKEDKKK
jgi:hypothetical protein